MDNKELTTIRDNAMTSKPLQSQQAGAEPAAVSPKPNGGAVPNAKKSGIVDLSAAEISRLETAKQSGGLSALLESSRAELDRVLAETQQIHESSWRVIHRLLEDSHLKASQAVDARLARFQTEIHDRVSNETSLMLENFDIEAGARLNARLDQALAGAKQRQHSIEQDLAVAVAENRKQLDQISTSAAEGLREHEQNLLHDLQKQAESHLVEFTKSARKISDNIHDLGESLGGELKQRAEEAARFFESRVEQVWQVAVERAEQRITDATQACTADLAKQARELIDREMSEFLVQALRRFDRSSDGRPQGSK